MTTTAQKYARLLDAISQGSDAGKVKWTKDDWDDEVRARIGEFQIGFSPGKRGNTSVVNAKIYNSDESIIDQFDDDDLATVAPSKGFDTFWGYMTDIYRTGCRKASGADRIIDKIIDTLDDDPF